MVQAELLPVENRSLQPQRLRKGGTKPTPERIFSAEWLAANRRRAGINGGNTLLELILAPDCRRAVYVSRRDAEVAACVIQWLGTNCGGAFLRTCEDKIDAEDARAIERRRRERERERRRLADLAEEKARRERRAIARPRRFDPEALA